MPRLLWLIAGCIITYVASGYVEGLLTDEKDTVKSE